MLANNISAFQSQSVTGQINNLKNVDKEHINSAAKDFEALFIGQMVEHMFGDSIGSEAFGSQESEEVYKGLMVQEYGKMIVNAGGIGIADYVKRELLKQQEVER